MKSILSYTTKSQAPIVACSISYCGNYLAFNSDVNCLRIVSLKNTRSNSVFERELDLNNTLPVLFEAQHVSAIRCLDFGKGMVEKSRLPHRSSKRRASYAVLDNVCLLAVGLQSGHVKIYSLIPSSVFDFNTSNQCVVEYGGRAKLVLTDGLEELTTVSFSFDGSLRLATASVDGKIRLWDMWDDGNMYKVLKITGNFRPHDVAWGNNSRQICVVGSKGKGFVYQSEKPCLKIAALIQCHYNDISCCKYSYDDSLLATGSYDTSVVVWCAGTYRPMLQIWHTGSKPSKIFMGGSHNRFIRNLDFSQNCVSLVSISDDSYIRLWSIEDASEPMDQIKVESSSRKLLLSSVKFLPDGSKYFVCTSDGRLLLLAAPGCDGTQSLANLCRRQVRQRLVSRVIGELRVLPSLTEVVEPRATQFPQNLEDTSMLEQFPSSQNRACVTQKKVSAASARRHSMVDSDNAEEVLMRDVVDELPLPVSLKCYLQFGLPGSEMLSNSQPQPSCLHSIHPRRLSLF